MTVVAVTGHRPEQLGDLEWVRETLSRVLAEENPSLLYQGMAAGADLLSAGISYELRIPYIAVKPWAGHCPRESDRKLYSQVSANAFQIIEVDPSLSYPGVWVYHNRNKYMVDHADILIAVWNGSSSGGTASCVKYARQKSIPIIQIDPVTKQVTYPEVRLF